MRVRVRVHAQDEYEDEEDFKEYDVSTEEWEQVSVSRSVRPLTGQTDGQTYRQTDRQTDRQIGRQTDR